MAQTGTRDSLAEELYGLLTDDEQGHLCKDIPESACRHQPRNFLLHALSLGATKTGDGLADPKLVLAWLLGAMGAPAAAIGLLVPVRESLALLPQLFTAARIRALPRRKWAWAAGSAVQGLCVLAMAAVALAPGGAASAWIIVALLAVFAAARSVCSVSYKDVLGKTVSKQTRGAATGAAGSAAALVVLAFGAALSVGLVPLTVPVVCGALATAGALWLLAALLFTRIEEAPGATEGGGDTAGQTLRQFALLRRDAQLVRFIAVRGLLIPTALAPPFFLAVAGQSGGQSLGTLGPFVIASSLASVLSTYVWGRFADRSSRRVLLAAALGGAAATGIAGALALAAPRAAAMPYLVAVMLFALMVAYQGVRHGRSIHLVDMAPREDRAAYTALSNTAIGALLLLGGAFGFVAEFAGVPAVLVLFSGMCLGAAALARGLEEVQR